jgi:hypothetical protein
MRYYLAALTTTAPAQALEVRMVSTVRNYGFEYLGN